MDKLKILTFFLLLIAVSSCRQVKEIERIKYVTKDSIETKDSIVEKERLVYSPVDSAKIKALVKCPDVAKTTVKHKHATASFEIKGGVATVDCFCDSTAIKVKERERFKTVIKQHLKEFSEVSHKTTREPYVPMWARVFAGIGVAATLYGIFRIIKLFK